MVLGREAEGVHQVAGDVYLLLRVLERLRPVGGARAGGRGRAERLAEGAQERPDEPREEAGAHHARRVTLTQEEPELPEGARDVGRSVLRRR